MAAECTAAGGRGVAYGSDVSDGDQVAATVAAVVAEFGGIDVVHSNAGRLTAGTVTTGSISGLFGEPGLAAYTASKAAVINLTRQMAIDFAASGIRVNSVCPGWVDTGFNDPQFEHDHLHLLAPFRARVTIVRPRAESLPGPHRTVVVERLREVCAGSRVVALAAALTPRTRRLIGPAELAAMGPGCWLVNVTRGELVDTAALVEALRTQRLGGACLDVTDPNRYRPVILSGGCQAA